MKLEVTLKAIRVKPSPKVTQVKIFPLWKPPESDLFPSEKILFWESCASRYNYHSYWWWNISFWKLDPWFLSIKNIRDKCKQEGYTQLCVGNCFNKKFEIYFLVLNGYRVGHTQSALWRVSYAHILPEHAGTVTQNVRYSDTKWRCMHVTCLQWSEVCI